VKKALLGSIAALPLVLAGALTNAGSANAAALTGEFQFNGGFSSINFSQAGVTFNPGILPSSQIILTGQTGSFTPFTSALIKSNIPSVPVPPGPAIDPFLDFSFTFPAVATGNTFTLTKVDGYDIQNNGANVAVNLAIFGFFKSSTGEITQGAGNLTWQINNTNAAAVKAQLAAAAPGDFPFKNIAFSGAAFTATAVPEPTTLAGLGLVAGALAVSRRRKANASNN